MMPRGSSSSRRPVYRRKRSMKLTRSLKQASIIYIATVSTMSPFLITTNLKNLSPAAIFLSSPRIQSLDSTSPTEESQSFKNFGALLGSCHGYLVGGSKDFINIDFQVTSHSNIIINQLEKFCCFACRHSAPMTAIFWSPEICCENSQT